MSNLLLTCLFASISSLIVLILFLVIGKVSIRNRRIRFKVGLVLFTVFYMLIACSVTVLIINMFTHIYDGYLEECKVLLLSILANLKYI